MSLVLKAITSAAVFLITMSTYGAAQERIDTLAIGSARAINIGELGVPGSVASHKDGLVVIDRDAHSVIAFDAQGQRRWKSGRVGAGPGEFRSPSGVWVRNDTVYVFDSALRRLSLLNQNGRFIRSVVIGGHPDGRGAPSVVAIMHDGSIIARWFASVGKGFSRDTTPLTRHSKTGEPAGLLGRWAADERLTAVIGSEYHVLTPPFAAKLSVASCGETTIVANGNRPILETFAQSGSPVPLHLKFLPPRLAPAQVQMRDNEWIRQMAANARTASLGTAIRGLRDMLDPNRATAVAGNVMFDPGCAIWVSQPDGGNAARWWKVGRDGRAQATFSVPRQKHVKAIGSSWVVLETSDADGLRTLSVHSLAMARQ